MAIYSSPLWNLCLSLSFPHILVPDLKLRRSRESWFRPLLMKCMNFFPIFVSTCFYFSLSSSKLHKCDLILCSSVDRKVPVGIVKYKAACVNLALTSLRENKNPTIACLSFNKYIQFLLMLLKWKEFCTVHRHTWPFFDPNLNLEWCRAKSFPLLWSITVNIECFKKRCAMQNFLTFRLKRFLVSSYPLIPNWFLWNFHFQSVQEPRKSLAFKAKTWFAPAKWSVVKFDI